MASFLSILANQRGVVTRESILEYASTWLEHFWVDSIQLFAASLVLSAIWLAWGRARSWRPNHRVVPLGFWALQSTQLLLFELGYHGLHFVYVAALMISSAVALAAISGMVALSAWRTTSCDSPEALNWILVLAPLVTVFLDGAFSTLCLFFLTI